MNRPPPQAELSVSQWSGSRVARNTSVRALADVGGRLAVIGLFAVATRSLGPGEFGKFVLASSLAALLSALAGLGVDDIAAREVARRPEHVGQIVRDSWAIKLMTGACGALAVVGLGFVLWHQRDVRVTIAILAASGLVELLARTVYAAFQGLGDLAPEAVARTLQGLLRTAIGIAALVAGGGIVALSIVYSATSVVALAYACRRLAARSSLRGKPSFASAARLFRAGLPVGVGAVFETIVLTLTMLILAGLKGVSSAGLFGAASRLVDSARLVGSAFASAVAPVLARAARTRPKDMRPVYEAATKVVVTGLLPVSVALILFAEPATRVLFGGDFAAATSAVRILAALVVLHSLSEIGGDAIIAAGRQRDIAWIAAVSTVSGLGLTLALVPRWAEAGAAAAATISAGAYALLSNVRAVWLIGGISLRRIVLAPSAAAVAMVVPALLIDNRAVALAATIAGYTAVLYTVERLAYPADLARALAFARGRSPEP